MGIHSGKKRRQGQKTTDLGVIVLLAVQASASGFCSWETIVSQSQRARYVALCG